MRSSIKAIKQRQLAKNIVASGLNLTEAYVKTYPNSSREAANAHVNRVITPELMRDVVEIANSKGFTVDACVETLSKQLQAKKPVVVNGKIELCDDNGAIIEASKTGLKLHRVLSDGDTHIDARQIHVSISEEKLDALVSAIKEFKLLREGSTSSSISAPTQNVIDVTPDAPPSNA